VPASIDVAAAGACVQAAAALAETSPGDVAAAWQLGDGAAVEPRAGVPRREIRAAHAAEARHQTGVATNKKD
jgi:hypothetical protein